jgi:hypothetical protein
VGEPPVSVTNWVDARRKRFVSFSAPAMGVFAGGFVGYLIILEWPGISAWPFLEKWELFFAVGIPAGVLNFFGARAMSAWIGRASTLHLRRLAVAESKLHMEPVSGRPFDYPLDDARVSPVGVAPGWYAVALPSGRFVAQFYVTEPVARAIQQAQRSARSPMLSQP